MVSGDAVVGFGGVGMAEWRGLQVRRKEHMLAMSRWAAIARRTSSGRSRTLDCRVLTEFGRSLGDGEVLLLFPSSGSESQLLKYASEI